jgi:DNA-binding XRE family transcriptional regulator/phage FluMu protein Com
MERGKVTQEMLAKHLGVTRQTVSLYANGQIVPDIYKAQQIADYFDVGIGYLLSDIEKIEYIYNNEQFKEYCQTFGGDLYRSICVETVGLTEEAQKKIMDRIEELKEIPKYNRVEFSNHKKICKDCGCEFVSQTTVKSIEKYCPRCKELSHRRWDNRESGYFIY